MKINFKDEKPKDIYKVGNVIKQADGNLFLVAKGIDDGYMLVDLTENIVLEKYGTLEDLRIGEQVDTDTLVNVEINVFK
ncbi:hypothetical protein FYN05_06870 [Lactobacillus salivarius]|uniref:hypothetical protein n=1 Tax=Ligilactobacillus salivarius TaxID=1624 RepID=UPI00136CD10F|nr:hypothetical protein [Ligilactobacillus salivarius]MYV21523.1 hypothetical protein [Ligilactobacillus salivarius]